LVRGSRLKQSLAPSVRHQLCDSVGEVKHSQKDISEHQLGETLRIYRREFAEVHLISPPAETKGGRGGAGVAFGPHLCLNSGAALEIIQKQGADGKDSRSGISASVCGQGVLTESGK